MLLSKEWVREVMRKGPDDEEGNRRTVQSRSHPTKLEYPIASEAINKIAFFGGFGNFI
jgi:hypothetical protein